MTISYMNHVIKRWLFNKTAKTQTGRWTINALSTALLVFFFEYLALNNSTFHLLVHEAALDSWKSFTDKYVAPTCLNIE